nr:MAG TPA: hypothetical protein [Caudoviricetes sp.]
MLCSAPESKCEKVLYVLLLYNQTNRQCIHGYV